MPCPPPDAMGLASHDCPPRRLVMHRAGTNRRRLIAVAKQRPRDEDWIASLPKRLGGVSPYRAAHRQAFHQDGVVLEVRGVGDDVAFKTMSGVSQRMRTGGTAEIAPNRQTADLGMLVHVTKAVECRNCKACVCRRFRHCPRRDAKNEHSHRVISVWTTPQRPLYGPLVRRRAQHLSRRKPTAPSL